MRKLFFITVLLACMMANPVYGDDTWTEVGLYGFMSGIKGETKIGSITNEMDASFSDILSNLDMGFMGFLENRHGKWSFLLDVFYVALSADKTKSSNGDLSVTLDAELKQTLSEAFLGYRVLDWVLDDSRLGVDLLVGARYNKIEIELGTQVELLGLSGSRARNPSEEWTDGVAAIRAQYENSCSWGVSGWADIGKGSDSTTYQLIGLVNYTFENNIRLFGGYRHYNFDYENGSGASRFGIDADYSGPLVGVSYRF